MISFGAKYWIILLPALLIAAAGVVLLMYYRNRENTELTKNQVRLLMVLRFISFFTIAFFLLSPFLKNLKKIVLNPIVVAAWDNSGSIVSEQDSARVVSEINRIKNQITEGLGKNYTLVNYTFGEETQPGGNTNFNEKKSDYSELITSIANNHFNENIGAVIIAGDGIYNQGKNPVNLAGEINFPVFTIGLGDTTEITDVRVENIRANRTAFSGNRFPVEIDVHISKLAGIPLKLSVKQENEEQAGIVVTPPNNDYFFTQQFVLEAGTPGLKHFTAVIQTADNERNTKNNAAGFVINVLENKQKILILSDGPHPDIGAIKNTLDLQTTYDVSVFTEEPYPAALNDFNLIILNQLPSSGKSVAQIIGAAEKGRIPILFIVGNKTFLPQLNTFSQGAQITPLAGSAEEAQAVQNNTYRIFTLSEEFREILFRFPPLQAPFADYQLDAEFSTLFYQKIKNIETGRPLIATGTINGRKTGFIFGEGIWRWRLFNSYFNQGQTQFNELVNQLVQYLALRENEDNFIVEFAPVYAETDDIILKAEVYNETYEPITTEEVTIEVQNEAGEKLNFTFDVQGNSYFLNAGHFATGDYNFTANVTIGNETFTETGNFTVVPVNLENIETRANHQVLFQLAKQSGGDFYLPGQVDRLIQEIGDSNRLKPAVYFQEMVNELLNLRWLFFVLLTTLGVEWFLRKYWGIY